MIVESCHKLLYFNQNCDIKQVIIFDEKAILCYFNNIELLLISIIILTEVKQKLLSALVKSLQALSKTKEPFLLFLKIAWWPFKIILKFTLFKMVLMPLYHSMRQIKNSWLKISPLLVNSQDGNLSYYLTLAAIVFIAGVGLFGSLEARGVRPENYGKKSLLYYLTPTQEDYSEENLEAEIKEGPLEPITISPLGPSDEAALSSESNKPLPVKGMDSLINTTNDETALVSPEITDPTLITKKRSGIIKYTVQPGDVIGTVAERFGVSVNTVLWENNLSLYSLIKPGQVLKILPVTGLSYAIKSGDSLDKIAKKYQGRLEEIIEFNKLASAGDITLGQIIIIPGGVKAGTVATSPSIRNIFTPAPASSSRLLWPTTSRRLTQYFRLRHGGIDIGNKTGQPIYAAENGRVEVAGWNRGGYGYYVIINHGGGLKTLYAHSSKLYVKVGEVVGRGQVIAAIGSTGRSTGPHLHFEVFINSIRTNPLSYTR